MAATMLKTKMAMREAISPILKPAIGQEEVRQ
jgi:hypothetical protein